MKFVFALTAFCLSLFIIAGDTSDTNVSEEKSSESNQEMSHVGKTHAFLNKVKEIAKFGKTLAKALLMKKLKHWKKKLFHSKHRKQ
ncbi:hypothetical protein GE061_008912 [Apolygus lucorum]|uniref:Uncharacterized protein n=1 Tax=Apolygus lucorum TaxID=248454 RepID=A0A8S9XZ39_APOLU|nr:hypothetical protein GE061_008912 [Apolygus lucorum]